jgi:hypothetical protein
LCRQKAAPPDDVSLGGDGNQKTRQKGAQEFPWFWCRQTEVSIHFLATVPPDGSSLETAGKESVMMMMMVMMMRAWHSSKHEQRKHLMPCWRSL